MTVIPEAYVSSMTDRWAKLKLSSNGALEAAWYDMASTFNDHILDKANETWSVIQLPTGSGKTQGLAVYCAELQKLSEHPGVLIITRFTAEADKLADAINKLSASTVANADHSDNASRLSKPALRDIPVLIITHAAYSNLLDEIDNNESSYRPWDSYSRFKDGYRKLTIVDEALNTIEHINIEVDDIRRACVLPIQIDEQYPRHVAYLKDVLLILETYARDNKITRKYLTPTNWTYKEGGEGSIFRPDFKPLLGQLELCDKDNKQQAETLNQFLDMIAHDSIYVRLGSSRGLHKGRLSLPAQVKNAVILDATAGQDSIYDLLGKFIDIHPLPAGIRNYKNVNLNIMYGIAVGRDALKKKPSGYFLSLANLLSPSIVDKRTLFCVHLASEKQFALVKETYPKAKVAHWNAIDGKNDWEKYEAVVLCGLPFIGRVNAECAVIAAQTWHGKSGGAYDPRPMIIDEETMSCDFEDIYEDADTGYERSHIVVSLIQAINRVRCRQSIDSEGNCAPTNVYLFLHRKGGVLERYILNSIRQAMPNINVSEVDIPEVLTTEKLSKKEMLVIAFFMKKEAGTYALKDIYQEIGVLQRTLQRCTRVMQQEPESLFSRQMQQIGVSYLSVRGKYGQSSFIKA